MKATKEELHRKITLVKKPNLNHLNRQIVPIAHTSMYNFHKYWSRKTWNVVGEFIKTYSEKNDIVFDPFGGSGVTAIEALRHGRKVIIADLNPIATEITRLTIKSVNLTKLHQAYKKVEDDAKVKIQKLYTTTCRKCKKEIIFDCAIWILEDLNEIRYKKCPHCGDSRRGKSKPNDYDNKLLQKILKHKIKEWYPPNKLYYSNGNPFKEKQRYESIPELFTTRNLYALAILMESIEKESNKELREFLKIAFSSMVHLCSKMNPVSEAGHFTPFSSAWTQHSYWFPSGEYMEQNVWYKYESAILGGQGLIKAKEESNKLFNHVRFGKKIEEIIQGTADVLVYTGDSITFMDKVIKTSNKEIIDYIFTDPPYDSSVQYGELSYMWNAWLKLDKNYLEKIDSSEVIHNEKQNKDFVVYTALLQNSFNGMFKILKPGKFLTLTFHNPTFKVRNSTIRTGVLVGFELQKIHHQELARPSAKSLLQPFGSAQGDFYLRFYKPESEEGVVIPERIDEIRFEKIVVETTTRILAERGEPTPYTIIINAIDPELTKQGFFSELESGLAAETVLKNHLKKEFKLVDGVIGGSSGKLWWFTKPNLVSHLEKIPLTERVEQTVLRELQSKGKVTFTDIWEAVSIEFPNSLTSDQSSIKNSLEDYARKVQGGYWMIKSNFRPGVIEKEHTTVLSLLSEIGTKAGYKIYIGKVEQSHKIDSNLVKKQILSDYINYPKLIQISNAQNISIVDDIDLLWILDNQIKFVFEVESTTSMTSALHRGSNVESSVPKIMLFPADRHKQFERKMKAPMFHERFEEDNWKFILFEELYLAWNKDKSNVDITTLYGIISKSTSKKKQDDDQLLLGF